MTGAGPLRTGQIAAPGTIRDGEVELARRILYSFGGDGHIAVTKAEADALFAINAALVDPTASAAWSDLFVKAIANVVMASSGYSVPSREEALRRESFLDRRHDAGPVAVLRAMVAESLGSVWRAYQEQSPEERALARLERQRIEIITNEEITEGEAAWLAERIGRDGRLTAAEDALLAYVAKHSHKIHPVLQEALGRLTRAA